MLLALKDSPLNSAFVVENLCGQLKCTINYDKTIWKVRQFLCDYMVDFRRHSHIYVHINSV